MGSIIIFQTSLILVNRYKMAFKPSITSRFLSSLFFNLLFPEVGWKYVNRKFEILLPSLSLENCNILLYFSRFWNVSCGIFFLKHYTQKICFWLLSNWKKYDSSDSFPFGYEPTEVYWLPNTMELNIQFYSLKKNKTTFKEISIFHSTYKIICINTKRSI